MSNRKTSTSLSVRGAMISALAVTSHARQKLDADSRDMLSTVQCLSATPSSPTRLTLPTQDGGTPTVTLAERDPKAPAKQTQGTQGCEDEATTTSTLWLPGPTVHKIIDPRGKERPFTSGGACQDQIATETLDASTGVASEMPGAEPAANEPHAKAQACTTVTVTKTKHERATTLTVYSVTPGAPGATRLAGLARSWAKGKDSAAAGRPRPLGF